MDRTVMRALRQAMAKEIQVAYYRKGLKVKCAAIEGSQPTLKLTWILFDETTAYQAETSFLNDSVIKLGFQKVHWNNGFGEGSTNTWKRDDVKETEFSEIHTTCEAVRRGEKSPDAINATVANPK